MSKKAIPQQKVLEIILDLLRASGVDRDTAKAIADDVLVKGKSYHTYKEISNAVLFEIKRWFAGYAEDRFDDGVLDGIPLK